MEQIGQIVELLEFAMNRELEANEFYRVLARRVSNPEMGVWFEQLAAEELDHKAKLELEINKLGHVTPDITRPPDAKELANLKISDYMVDIGEDLDVDYEDALVLAMKKEKLSFRLYIDLLTMVPPDMQEPLLELAEEEARHKMRFEIAYDNLQAKKGKK